MQLNKSPDSAKKRSMALNIHDSENEQHINNGKRNSSNFSVENQYDDFEHSRSISVE